MYVIASDGPRSPMPVWWERQASRRLAARNTHASGERVMPLITREQYQEDVQRVKSKRKIDLTKSSFTPRELDDHTGMSLTEIMAKPAYVTLTFSNVHAGGGAPVDGFRLTFTIGEKNVKIPKDPVPIPVLRALWHAGMEHVARAIDEPALAKIAGLLDLDSLFLVDGCLMIPGAVSSWMTTDCPDDFVPVVHGLFRELQKLSTGRRIIEHLRASGAQIVVRFAADRADYDRNLVGGRSQLVLDPSIMRSKTYLGFVRPSPGAAHAMLAECPQPPVALFGHELVHAVHAAESGDGYRARLQQASEAPVWSNHEEELTIKGRIAGGGAASDISECHLLADLGLPFRWGHDRASPGTLLSTAELSRHYPADLVPVPATLTQR